MTVAPFPLALSEGAVDRIVDALEAAGHARHRVVLTEHLMPYALRWLSAGVPRATVDAELRRLSEVLAVVMVQRKAGRLIPARTGGDPL